MSERRHTGGGRRLLPWLGWGLAGLLAAHLAWSLLHSDKDGTPQGLVTPAHLQWAALWVPAALAVAMSVLGARWATRAFDANGRSSLLWARRGHVMTIAGIVVLLFAVFEPENIGREWLAGVVAMVVCAQSGLFAMASLREYRRGEAGGGKRRRASDEESPSAPVPVPTQSTADAGSPPA